MRAIASITFVCVVLLAGCGGGDSESEGDDPADPSPTAAGSNGAATAATPASTAVADDPGGPAGAVVTVGTETFEFDSIGGRGCVRVGGQVSGGADMTGADVTASFTIPPADWESNDRFNNPPSLSVIDRRSDPAVRWDAGNLGTVDSYTIDDGGVSGTATFVSERLAGSQDFVSETVSGTFDISCGS